LNRAATEEGLSRSALIRTIIKRYLQERDEKG
jgi:metal-responsive CopG/Arc/MetJ family transcriptional regulator